MNRWLCPMIVTLCLCSGCLSLARKVEQAARGEKRGDRGDREERERPRQMQRLAEVDLSHIAAHPRLFLSKGNTSCFDDVSCAWQAKLTLRATDTLDKPPIPFEPKKVLAAGREALRRISLLALVYRFTGEQKYANAARRELANVCAFEHWQPDAFLATAEMMTAVSIGYDWLYDVLPAAERKVIVAALVRNGLRPAIAAYRANDAWPTMRNNWNLVCNGGTIVAALAVAEEEPKLAQQAMDGAMESIRLGLALYDEHGGTPEGPMYQSYATRYLTFAAAALETATTDATPLTHAPQPAARGKTDAGRPPLNWLRAGDYRMAMTGPTARVANFGDCNETLGNTAWILWLVRNKLTQAAEPDIDANDLSAFQVNADYSDPSPFDFLWYAPPNDIPPEKVRGLQARGVRPPGRPSVFGSAVTMREDTYDLPNAAFVAIRTGSTAASHSHLDLGNFVYDVLGERFACDLGADSYDLPGYLHNNRPDYLRTSTPGHNCLTRGDDSQPLAAEAKVTTPDTKRGQSVRVDLSDAYPDARSVARTFTLDGRVLTVTDTWRSDDRTTLNWHLHTPARVTINKNGAILDSNGKRVELRVLEPADATLTAEPDETSRPQLPVEGITHIRLRLRNVKDCTIRVQLRPLDERP